jgi:hypothetical protein
MIEKFNFYDIYGYFLPGLALIAVFWLPFGLVLGKWPSGDIASAVFGIALAYFAGHMMLYVSTNTIPSYDVQKSTADHSRYPSETVLDADSKALPEEAKEKIAEAVRKELKLELRVDDSSGAFDGIRKTAFNQARQRLSLEKLQSYAEQFQGMYSLARGFVVAFSAGAAYYSGWVLGAVHCRPLFFFAVALGLLSLLALANLAIAINQEKNFERKKNLEYLFGCTWLLASLAAGWTAGFIYNVSAAQCAFLAFAAGIAFVLSLRCYAQYRSFTVQFAVTVWQNFAAFVLRNPTDQKTQINFE